MPIVAVGAAIAAIGVAAVDVAAVGIAAIGITEALAVTAAVGATIGAVGVVTNNKTLAMVGAGIGVVGAIGGLASAAGVFGSTAATGALQGATATGETLDAATAAGTAGVDTGATFADSLTPATAGGTGAAGTGVDTGAFSVPANYAGLIGEATTTPFSEALASGNQDIINSFYQAGDLGRVTSPDVVSANLQQGTPAQIDYSIGKASAEPTPVDAFKQPETPAAPSTQISQQATPSVETPSPTPTSSVAPKLDTSGLDPITGKPFVDASTSTAGGVLKDILNWAKQPQVSLGLMQTGGSFLKGLTDTLSPAQINAYNGNAANNNAQAGLTNLQAANLAQPKATLTPTALPQVTGAPAPLTPPGSTPPGITATAPGGLINRPLTQVGLTA